ncbi:DNA helicase II [Microbulbifer thermotolerans]|uniref:DNA helicase II n=1 Tax=Microbulbifer thermotolerans TaxID=252514 RepID=UPI00224AF3E8|nr:DNA helicase II [Microbulbifer thermotolerans]MCX2778580.1 DNA helicase II [Microbulbifer thermotolerans]MCX2803911.1 DNA helicase II [Microbulbifer thermotolerans]MCX2840954.1 DNA helicase II [Microbulbifer thermotolerans]
MDVSLILDPLNDAQREAVAAPPGNQLVLAGAGSGKTRVLVHRIAWLMQVEGASPYSILAVTFTNKAAREMRARIEELLGVNTFGMWVGTFHGLAHRLLKAHWQEARLPQNFQILDSDDQLRLIKRVQNDLQLDEKKWPPRETQWWIGAQKDEGLRPQYIQAGGDQWRQTMVRIYFAYEEACQRGGLVDFGELLLRAHELLRDNDAVLAHYRRRFPFILVDEFQDTNTIQYAWLRLLAGDQCHITAVGDDDQSIYGWRGAKIENIQHFAQDRRDVQTVRLEQNYRSTATILNAANAVISHNTGRLGKELWTEGEEGDPISLYAAYNEQDEARFIVERVKDWVRDGNRRDSVAILYRSNAQSRVLEEALLREQVPYRIYGGQRFYERMEIKNALSYMRLISNRDDDTAFERVVNTPTRGIGARTVDTVRAYAREHGCSLWQASRQMLQQRLLAARAGNALQSFLDLVNQLAANAEDKLLEAIAEDVIETSGLLEFHSKEKGEKGQTRVENLKELVSACRAFEGIDVVEGEDEEERPLLDQFLDSAALDAGEGQADEFEDAVQLMTLHSAKGLEFPLVFMSGVEENLFPNKMSMQEPGRMEEERRLCYVGITRAMQKLYITYAENRRLFGSETYNSPSRFIGEIPAELVHEVRLKTEISRPLFQPDYGKVGKLSDPPPDFDDLPPLALGGRVEHPKFGEGTVIQFEGSGPRARVQVNFDDAGSKWLVVAMAKLQPL